MKKLCNKKVWALAGLALGFVLGVSAAGPNFVTGTFIVKGSVTDWQNKLLDSSAGVVLRAVNASGQVIAQSLVRDPRTDGANFYLQIPLSTTATDQTAAVGDTLNCVMDSAEGLRLGVDPLTVGAANTATNIVFKLVDLKTFEKNGETVAMPSEYVNNIAIWLDMLGLDAYDPWGDYDNDGATNYAEYLAGTNPFDASDRLRVLDYKAVRDSDHLITFEYVNRHVYAVKTAFSLAKPAWADQAVKVEPKGSEYTTIAPGANGEEGGGGLVTILVAPAANVTQQFFKLEAK